MIYLDTSICVYALEAADARGDRARDLLAAGGKQFCASPLVQMECLVKPFQTGDVTLERRFRFFFSEILMLEITSDVFERAARVRASTGLKTADALHVAVATAASCDAVWTADIEMVKRSRGYAIDICAGL